MTTGEIECRIRTILQRVARLDGEYSPRADLFRELGMKSVVALDLLLSLEEEFGVSIADAAFGEARSVSALVDLVQGLR
jgi:acyl carrier protein